MWNANARNEAMTAIEAEGTMIVAEEETTVAGTTVGMTVVETTVAAAMETGRVEIMTGQEGMTIIPMTVRSMITERLSHTIMKHLSTIVAKGIQAAGKNK
jgi:hypothetical protein